MGVVGGGTKQGNNVDEKAGIVKSSRARTWPKDSLSGTETTGTTEEFGEGGCEVVAYEKTVEGVIFKEKLFGPLNDTQSMQWFKIMTQENQGTRVRDNSEMMTYMVWPSKERGTSTLPKQETRLWKASVNKGQKEWVFMGSHNIGIL